MIPGVSGSLLSHEAWRSEIRERFAPQLDQPGASRARARLRSWHQHVRADLGPASSARTVFDRIAAPLMSQLGYRVLPSAGGADALAAVLEASGHRAAALLVTAWGRDLSSAWREAVRHGIAQQVRWCVCVNGPALRLVDSRRTYSRRFIEFDLHTSVENTLAFEVLWGLLRAQSWSPAKDLSLIDQALQLSEEHRTGVRNSLQEGVEQALTHLEKAFRAYISRRLQRRRRTANTHNSFNEALIVIYRILFLLFAEARGLVPRWHPTYRDAYTIEALRDPVELLPRPRGLWETLQAISRLAHRGCRIGSLRVPPFNGHLFSPGEAPLSDAVSLDDGIVRTAVLALTTRPVKAGRTRVVYGDLGVEQLGGIYERLLDFDPAPDARPARTNGAGARKRTGSFYTPRSLTEFIVRRTLAPLVRDASPEQILSLRVLDPAMGSGAFLVAACRYLSAAYEAALVREGDFSGSDISDAERVSFRRAVAQQCLFGVDLNPMAVQLGRLSVWLATLAPDRPLTFLDHRLRVGNSLVGARFEDLLRQPPSTRNNRRRASLPLFDDRVMGSAIQQAVGVRLSVAAAPDDTIEQVREKERALATLSSSDLVRWKAVADLWCSVWFSGRRDEVPFGALADAVLGRFAALPAKNTELLLAEARALADEHRFFHWTLEFPEIFYEEDGSPRMSPGFDAILGNPPWEMLRGDSGEAQSRNAAREAGTRLTRFARTSGVYTVPGSGHANLYQLFLERALGLVRPSGRIGFVLPGGFAIDQGSSGLRNLLLDRTSVDGLVSVENREGIFPIHRGVKFLLLTTTNGGCSSQVSCRFGISQLADLDRLPDAGFNGEAIAITRPLLERISGHGLAIPDIRTAQDLEILSTAAYRWPRLEEPEGWNARFGRELNATDDRSHFVERSRTRGALPIAEGKHLSPFAVDTSAAEYGISPATASKLLDGDLSFRRARLAYRDVAASTNRLSLIAAIVPTGVVTTHTLFCLRSPLDIDVQQFLCGIFNSYVANYLIRCRINTHVGTSVIARLPVPKLPRDSRMFQTIAGLAQSLATRSTDEEYASLQAHVARLYELTREQFARVLDTFPLVDRAARDAAARSFCDIVG